MSNSDATMKNVELQVEQIAKLLSERAQVSLPSNTEVNPREHIKVVTLRNGKELEV